MIASRSFWSSRPRHPRNPLTGPTVSGPVSAMVEEGVLVIGVSAYTQKRYRKKPMEAPLVCRLHRSCFFEVLTPDGEELFAGTVQWIGDEKSGQYYPKGLDPKKWLEVAFGERIHGGRITFRESSYSDLLDYLEDTEEDD